MLYVYLCCFIMYFTSSDTIVKEQKIMHYYDTNLKASPTAVSCNQVSQNGQCDFTYIWEMRDKDKEIGGKNRMLMYGGKSIQKV